MPLLKNSLFGCDCNEKSQSLCPESMIWIEFLYSAVTTISFLSCFTFITHYLHSTYEQNAYWWGHVCLHGSNLKTSGWLLMKFITNVTPLKKALFYFHSVANCSVADTGITGMNSYCGHYNKYCNSRSNRNQM